MKLRNKINLYTSVLFITLLILMNTSIYFLFSNLMISNELERAQAEIEQIISETKTYRAIDRINPDELFRAYVPVNGMIQLLDEDFSRKDFSREAKITSPSEGKLGLKTSTFYSGEVSELISYDNKRYAFISYPIVWSDGSVVNLQLTSSIQTTDDMVKKLRFVLITVTLIAMIPVIISSRFLSNLIIKPIRSMINTMKDIQKSGKLKRLKLEETSEEELVEMGQTFNHMIDLLQTNFEKQEQFVSNASHELRTPLTIIENYSALLKRRGLERPDLFEESIEAIHSEAVRMIEMTEHLLLVAKNQEQWNIKMTEINVTELVVESANAFQNTYQRNISVENDEVTIGFSDYHKLKQLLYIFLDNALKYSDKPITVRVGRTSNETSIQICDQGIGIPKDDLSKVFDRFYRVDQARSRKQGGSGLGLTMAKEIADAIGVRIELESLEDHGTTVTLLFATKETE